MSGAVPVLGAVGTVGKAATTFAAAQQQSGAQRIASGQAAVAAQGQMVAASQEELQAQSAALDIRDQLLRVLSGQNARFAASGIVPGAGTPEVLADQAEATADRQVRMVEAQGRIDAAGRRAGAAAASIQAGARRQAARATRTIGTVSAVADLASGGYNLFNAAGTPSPPSNSGTRGRVSSAPLAPGIG